MNLKRELFTSLKYNGFTNIDNNLFVYDALDEVFEYSSIPLKYPLSYPILSIGLLTDTYHISNEERDFAAYMACKQKGQLHSQAT